MGIWQRIKNMWLLAGMEIPEEAIKILNKPKKQYAEFIMPDRIKEILKERPNASLEDIIQD